MENGLLARETMCMPDPKVPEARYEIAAFEFARLALGSLITSCGGALIALMAYAGQQQHLPRPSVSYLGLAAGWLGASLLLALLAALISYLNQAFLAWGKPRPYLRIVAVCSGVLSLLSLTIGGVMALQMVVQTHLAAL
jgi:hypothetical protein